eukprot:TRINITY_DN4414_c0_g1_i2.p1 TRINITY_DN4414_c0_g1~~TRINITY_DN4414_c0_g1_i2.p1  ORF type:complete len:658 (+),score=169.12 TRINITY_DN4414_c0_g1_i2:43-2016(+)
MDTLTEDGVEFQRLKGISPCKDWEEREKRFVYILGECSLIIKTVLKSDTSEDQIKEWFSVQEGSVESITQEGDHTMISVSVKDQPTLCRMESSLGSCELIETAEGGVTERNEGMMLDRMTASIFHSSRINDAPKDIKRTLISYGAAVNMANGYSELVKKLQLPIIDGRFIQLVSKTDTVRLTLSPSEHVKKSYGKTRQDDRLQLEVSMRVSDILQTPTDSVTMVDIEGIALSPFAVIRVLSSEWEGCIDQIPYITNNPIISTNGECLWYDARQRKIVTKTEGVVNSTVFTWPTPSQVAADLVVIVNALQKTNLFTEKELIQIPASVEDVAKTGKSNFQPAGCLVEILLQNNKSLAAAKRAPPNPAPTPVPPKNVTSPNPVGIGAKEREREREKERELPKEIPPRETKRELLHRDGPPSGVVSNSGHTRDQLTAAMMRIVKQRRAGFIWCKEMQRDSHLGDDAKLIIDVVMAGEIISVQKGLKRDRARLIVSALSEALSKMGGRVTQEDFRSAKSQGSLNWKKVHSFTDLDATTAATFKKQQLRDEKRKRDEDRYQEQIWQAEQQRRSAERKQKRDTAFERREAAAAERRNREAIELRRRAQQDEAESKLRKELERKRQEAEARRQEENLRREEENRKRRRDVAAVCVFSCFWFTPTC